MKKHIDRSVLDFLGALAENNNREWFGANKGSYVMAKKIFEDFVGELIEMISATDISLKGLEAGSCIFRINRDTRFLNDKSPYKSNFGALIIKGGRKNIHRYAGYYLHIEPGGCFTAGGAYVPEPGWLSAIREMITGNPDEFQGIIENNSFRKTFGELEGEKLKKVPRGFEPGHPGAELIKYKSYLVSRTYSDNEVVSPLFIETVIKDFLTLKPLNDYLNGCRGGL